VDSFELGELNVASFETKNAGGKGINVSQVLKELKHESNALGFVGGFTGDYIKNTLDECQVNHDFVSVKEDTRINIKLKTGTETEINGNGPMISEENMHALLAKLENTNEQDFAIIAGSLPKSLPSSTYRDLLKFLNKKGVKVFLDAKGEALELALAEKPFLVKPNHHELGDVFNVKIQSLEEAVEYGKKLLELGPQNVIVSLGGDGALLIDSESSYFTKAPKGELKNSVGAGDSVVAGFTAKYIETSDKVEAFAFGVATGSATAFSFAFATYDHVLALREQVKIEKLS
jgi:1-phosphofructokinase